LEAEHLCKCQLVFFKRIGFELVLVFNGLGSGFLLVVQDLCFSIGFDFLGFVWIWIGLGFLIGYWLSAYLM